MTRLIYDISRLSTRVLNATPNGVDWIDSLLARHFLSAASPAQTLIFGFGGPRLFAPGALPNPLDTLDRAWGRISSSAPFRTPEGLVDILDPPSRADKRQPARRKISFGDRPARALRAMAAFGRYGLKRGENPTQTAPRGAIYINASHFPLEWPRHTSWLEERDDIQPIFFIHDLLPLELPHFFWRGEPERHAARLALLARRGAAALVASHAVQESLSAHMNRLGRKDLPILVAHPPVHPMFGADCPLDPHLTEIVYFVACGTIEPRKNHLLLVDIWRRLIADRGRRTPKLLVIGKRGWRCDAIVEALRAPDLKGHVLEVSGLSNLAYRALLKQARALLAPSFAEGFGLPMAEAIALGTPAVVSDIASHREQGGARALFLDPARPEAWLAAISALADGARPWRETWNEKWNEKWDETPPKAAQPPYFATLDAFLSQL